MSIRLRLLVTAALMLGLFAAVATTYGASARYVGAGYEPYDIRSLLDSWRLRADVPAVVLAQDANQRRWIGASGTLERDGAREVPTDARFRVASITKLFVATVVLQLVEEDRLDLDDPMSRYVADFPPRGVTIRQLLNHTSGIPDYSSTQGLGKNLLEHRERRWRTADVLNLVANVEPDFTAGTDYQYSNTNYVLLGEVITAITAAPWSTEVRRRVLDPLRLENTYVAGFEPARGNVIAGYFDADNDGDVENIETGRPWPALETSEGPAGAIVSTAADLLAFGDALFRGDLLTDASLREMVAEGPFHPRTSNYCLGVEVVRPDYRTTIWGHGGLLPGFKSVLWYVPSRDSVIVVLANDSRANVYDLAELVMRTLPKKRAPS